MNAGIYCDKALIHSKNILNLLPTNQTSISHSYELSSILDGFEFGPNDQLVSFDIQSLYTRVPVPETLVIVRAHLEKLQNEDPDLLSSVTSMSIDAIMDLLQFLLTDCFFVWAKKLYRQTSGLPMGGRLSPVLTGIFMEDLEDRALSLAPEKPRLYKRYVDDILIIWDKLRGSFNSLLEIMNQMHLDIILTAEEESSGRLPFLDILIARPMWAESFTNDPPTRPFYLEVYRKPTHGNRYLHFSSAHPDTLKRNVFRGLRLRANCLLRNHSKQLALEIAYLKRTFTHADNAYPPVVVNRWLRQFQRQLSENPSLLNLPTAKKRHQKQNSNLGIGSDQLGSDQPEKVDQVNGEELPVRTPWVPTIFSPYIPGLSEIMRSLASRYGVRSWFSFAGKLSGKLCNFKDYLHQSKSQFSVYSVRCNCGVRYVGETARNLKVRVREHQARSSGSAITVHVNDENEAENTERHGVDPRETLVLTQERNRRKRRFMESIVIKAKRTRLCNTGPSAYVSDVWDSALPRVAESFPLAMDNLD